MTHSILGENEARSEAAASVDVSTESPATFKSVLVGVDGTSTGRDAIALAEKLCDADGRLTLAHVVLVQQPVYGNFSSTGAGKKAREMLEREDEAAGVSAELTGIFARRSAAGCTSWRQTPAPICWSSAPAAAGRSPGCSAATTPAAR